MTTMAPCDPDVTRRLDQENDHIGPALDLELVLADLAEGAAAVDVAAELRAAVRAGLGALPADHPLAGVDVSSAAPVLLERLAARLVRDLG